MTVSAWGAATDRGRKRPVNEDSFMAEPPVFLVADGMGGHSAGDVASELAVRSFAGFAGAEGLNPDQVLKALDEANDVILRTAAGESAKRGMGTTVTGIALVTLAGSEHWVVFNVGDSRVYRLREDLMEQLTVDHSEVQELVDAGRLSSEQARTYPRRNVVTRSLGTYPAPVADSWLFPVIGDERFLICSDGLTTEVGDGDIHRCLVNHPGAQAAADALVSMALDAEGSDNVTVIVVDAAATSSSIDEDTSPR